MNHMKHLPHVTAFRTLSNFMTQVVLFFLGIYFTQIELTGVQQGILFAVYPLTGILSAVPIGLLNDRVYPRTLIAIGYLLIATQYLGITQTTDFYALIGLFTLGSLGAQLNQLSLDAFFYKNSDHQKPQQTGSYVGTFLSGSGLGIILGGLLLEKIPFTGMFLGIAIAALGASILSQIILPKTEVFHFEFHLYKKDLQKSTILLFATLIFLWTLHMGSEVTSYGLFLRENLGLSYTGMGLYMGLTILTMLGWARWAGHLIHHGTPIRYIVYAGLFFSGVGHFVVTVPMVEISIIGRIIHEAGDAFMFVFLYDGVQKLFPIERAGGNSGVIRFVQNGALILGVLAFAPLGKTYGNIYPLIIASTFSILAIPIAIRFRHLIKR